MYVCVCDVTRIRMLIVNPHRIFTQVSSVCNFKNKQQETGGTKEIQKLQTFEASLHVSGHEKLHTHTHTHQVAQTPLASRSNMTTQLHSGYTFTDHMKCSTSGF